MALWTPEHAKTLPPAIAVMLIIAIILRQILGDKPIKTRMIPFQVLAVIAFLLEVGKQVISFCRGYDLYHIPLHVCSVFIFMLPLMAFCGEKHKQGISAITAAFCTSVFMLMSIYPNLIYGDGSVRQFFTEFMSFHTVAFHNIVLFELILILFLRLYTPDKSRDPRSVIIFSVCFCIVSASMAQILKTNYANFYSCNIPVFENIRIAMQGLIGTVFTQIIYVLIVSALTISFVLGCFWLYYGLNKVLNRPRTISSDNSQA